MQLLSDIEAFIDDPSQDDFELLAMRVLRFQVERSRPYASLCRSRGVSIRALRRPVDAPPVPTAAFKALTLQCLEAKVVFHSSGTTRGQIQSRHFQPLPELYERVVLRSFPDYCCDPTWTSPPAVLSLIPPWQLTRESSLSFMVDVLHRRWADGPFVYGCDANGVDVDTASAFLQRHQERPVVILATALALHFYLEGMRATEARIPLASDSVLFETGGLKGRDHSTTRQQLLEGAERHLGLPSRRVVREYGMTELTSQAYTKVLRGGDENLFFTPHWLRPYVLDPESLAPVAAGCEGLLAFFDLGNVGSAAWVLTEDLGRSEGSGFRLLGRAHDAELRGCSLTVEQLARSAPAAR